MEIINITDEIIEVNVTEAIVNVVTQDGAYPLPSNVFSVFGRVGNVVGQAGDYNTDLVGEGLINKYYTDARSRAAISENITGLEYSSASGIFSLASGYLIPTQAMLDAKVPYTGATGNVALGEHQLSAGQVAFDQTPTGAAGVGIMRWNDTDGTLDLGLKGGNVTLQIGQEQVKRVVNGAGVNLTEAAYQVVKVIGAQGQRLQVALAQANNDLNSATALGIVTENINNNQEGFITTSGEVREINTTGSLQGETWADGDILYLSPSTAGKITNIKPVAPNHMVILGYVEYAHSQHGKIFVKIDNGYEIGELHDVNTTGEDTNDGLFLDSDGVWKPKTIAEVLGYTPVTSARTISTTSPLTGGGDLSADRTISMPAATTSVSGYLTSTDWNTFNAKQPLITAGTTAQYYRGDKTFQTLNTLAVPENTNLYYTQARFDTAFSGKSTTNLAEGTNLYFTTARAQAAISGTLPISVSGGVVSISQASGSSNGYLSSTDWNTFNAKQAALNGTGFVKISGTTISYDNSTYLTTISGITAGGELSGTYPNPTLVNSAVTGKILSGVNITGGTIADTDSILTAFGKLQNQINGLIGSSIYEGTWNASTNTPTLASGVGTQGSYYIVSVAGSTNIDGITDWNVGDWIIFDGTAWQQVDNTDAVVSVNGQTGAVSLTTDNITEGATNLYFTNSRSINSTLTGYTSGAGTISSSDTILTAIQKLNGNVSGLVTGVSSVFGRTGAVIAASGDYTTTQVTEGTNLYYTEGRVSANTDVAANTAARHAAVTLGTANGLSLSTQALSLGLASGSANGALSSTDWTTFNGKQAALNGTGFVKISGTTISYDNSTYLTTSSAASTYLPLSGGTLTGALSGTSATFSGDLTINTNKFFVNATSGNIGIGTSSPDLLLHVEGQAGQFGATSGYRNSKFTAKSSVVADKPGIILGYDTSGGGIIAAATESTGQPINFWTYNGSSWGERLRITSAGQVGIGTTDVSAVGSALVVAQSGTPNNLTIRRLDASNTSTARVFFQATNASSSVQNVGFIEAGLENSSSAGYLAFASNTTERMRITSGGNVGIGVTPSNWLTATITPLQVRNSSFAGYSQSGVHITYVGSNWYYDAGSTDRYISNGYASIFTQANGAFNWVTASSGTAGNAISFTQVMQLTSGGNLGIGSMAITDRLTVDGGVKSYGTSAGVFMSNRDNLGQTFGFYSATNMYVYNTAVGAVGNFNMSTGAYTAMSDSSLKKNIMDAENALNVVSKIKVRSYDWKATDIHEPFGVIAQELYEVSPSYVTKPIGENEYWGVSKSEMVPMLIKAIQELKAEKDTEILELRNQISELKALIAAK